MKLLHKLTKTIKTNYFILRHKRKFNAGTIPKDSPLYRKYLTTVWESKGIDQKIDKLFQAYRSYYTTAGREQEIDAMVKGLKDIMRTNKTAQIIEQGLFDEAVQRHAQASIQDNTNTIKQQLTSQHTVQLSDAKASFFESVLPFTKDVPAETNRSFANSNFTRFAAIEQQRKERELQELEKELSYQQREQLLEAKRIEISGERLDINAQSKQNSLDAQRLELQGERLDLNYISNEQKIAAQSQDLRDQKIELETLSKQIGIDTQNLDLKRTQIEIAHKFMMFEVQEKELSVQKQLLELATTTAAVEQEKKDIELQRKQIEILNMLTDYEMKTRELEVATAEKMLAIKEERLELDGERIELRIKNAEAELQLREEKADIQELLLDVKDREFSHKANLTLFEIERNRHDAEHKLQLLDLKQEGVELYVREKNLELQAEQINFAHRENALMLDKMQMVEDRNRLEGKLELEKHRALNAENKIAYLKSGGRDSIWYSIGELFGGRKKRLQ